MSASLKGSLAATKIPYLQSLPLECSGCQNVTLCESRPDLTKIHPHQMRPAVIVEAFTAARRGTPTTHISEEGRGSAFVRGCRGVLCCLLCDYGPGVKVDCKSQRRVGKVRETFTTARVAWSSQILIFSMFVTTMIVCGLQSPHPLLQPMASRPLVVSVSDV
jgi:hypothetical protein